MSLNLQDPLLRLTGIHPRQTGGPLFCQILTDFARGGRRANSTPGPARGKSSKVIISRIHKQNQTNQNSTSKLSSTPAQKQQNQTNTNSKQSKQIVISDRIRKGSNDPIQDHNRFGALADDGDMDTDEGTVRPGGRGSRPLSPVKPPKK